MKLIDKDIYFENIPIQPVGQEQLKEIEFLILKKESKDGRRRFVCK